MGIYGYRYILPKQWRIKLIRTWKIKWKPGSTEFRISGSRLKIYGLGFRILGSVSRVQDLGLRVFGLGFKGSCAHFEG